jgi:hypothetical protein
MYNPNLKDILKWFKRPKRSSPSGSTVLRDWSLVIIIFGVALTLLLAYNGVKIYRYLSELDGTLDTPAEDLNVKRIESSYQLIQERTLEFTQKLETPAVIADPAL